ncbi:MAG TPA: hypothetical protein VL995_09155 [Cellvibrio sp.]|nr:hypothetical protein [Cellvibrio sp.]
MKFKSVEIAGFRAYAEEGNGIFDFRNDDDTVANFVSIYAPNGFGKSSFYDAMEWAITNNIGRYIREGQKKINQTTSEYLNSNSSSQKILRNRYIEDEAPSYVRVNTTGPDVFHRKVRRAGVGQRDYTYEPSLTDGETKHLADIFLSQDAIDAFLKEERAESRYEKFMTNFGGADEKYRAQLFSLVKNCSKEILHITEKIRSLETLLDEPSLDFSVDQVNQTIRGLKTLGNDFSLIDASFSELAQTELQSLLTKRIVEIYSSSASLELKKKSIHECVETLPKLNEQRILQVQLKSKIKELHENREALEDISKDRDSKNALEQRYREMTIELTKLTQLIDQFDALSVTLKKIEDYNEQLHVIDNKLSEEKVVVEANGQISQSIREDITALNTTLAVIQDNLANVDTRFAELDRLQVLVNGYTQKKVEIGRKKNSSLALKKSLLEEKSNFERIAVGYHTISDLAISLLKPDPEFVLNYNNQLGQREVANLQLLELNNQSKSLGAQSNDLFNLIDLARSLISKLQSDSCPICNTSYSSHSELLSRLQSNNGIDSALKLILDTKNVTQNQLVVIDDFLARGLAYLNDLKSRAIQSIDQRITAVDNDINITLQEETSIEIDLNEKTDALHRLRAEVQNLSKEQYFANLENTYKDFKNKASLKDRQLSDAVTAMELSKERADNLMLQKVSITAYLDHENTSQLYLSFLELKFLYSIDGANIFSGLLGKQHELGSNLSAVATDISKFASLVSAKERSNQERGRYQSVDTLNEMLLSCVRELAHIEDSITKIEASLKWVIDDVGRPTEELQRDLSSALDQFLQELKQLEDASVLCNVLQQQLTHALPFIKYQQARTEIDTYQVTLNKLQVLGLALNQNLRSIETQLKERIDGFFYTDLITAIYRKIDPHPFFKTVKFECIFPTDDKPRLEVYLYEEDATQPISPGLYFSSAQLNILSLSIFLAKALHVEHKGEPVKVILIDDPIHSMDSINVLSVIDLLRNISVRFDRQIILSTHDENFYELLKLKIPEDRFGSKFIKFRSFGVVVQD